RLCGAVEVRQFHRDRIGAGRDIGPGRERVLALSVGIDSDRDRTVVATCLDGNSGKGLASGRNNLAGKKRHTIRGERRAWRRERVGGEAKRRKCSCDIETGFHRRDLSPSGVGTLAVTITTVPSDNDTPTAKGLQAAQASRTWGARAQKRPARFISSVAR